MELHDDAAERFQHSVGSTSSTGSLQQASIQHIWSDLGPPHFFWLPWWSPRSDLQSILLCYITRQGFFKNMFHRAHPPCTESPQTSWAWSCSRRGHPQSTPPPSCAGNQNTNTERCRWKMPVGMNTFGGRRSECFQLHISEQTDRVCQQLAGLSPQAAEAARLHCQQSARGWCHQITFRISGSMSFPGHNAAPLKVLSSAWVYTARGSPGTCRVYSSLQNRKTALGNRDLPEGSDLCHTRHWLVPVLDHWATVCRAVVSIAPPSGRQTYEDKLTGCTG